MNLNLNLVERGQVLIVASLVASDDSSYMTVRPISHFRDVLLSD